MHTTLKWFLEIICPSHYVDRRFKYGVASAQCVVVNYFSCVLIFVTVHRRLWVGFGFVFYTFFASAIILTSGLFHMTWELWGSKGTIELLLLILLYFFNTEMWWEQDIVWRLWFWYVLKHQVNPIFRVTGFGEWLVDCCYFSSSHWVRRSRAIYCLTHISVSKLLYCWSWLNYFCLKVMWVMYWLL